MLEPESLQTVNKLTYNSSQNSLTGGLPSSSYQNSLPGSVVAGFSQNPMPGGGCASVESGAEEIPRSDLACGDLACGEVAGFSGNYSESGSNTIICLREEDVPGASLNGRDPSQLHVVELKRWLSCRGATTAGRKEDLVKRLAN